MRSISNQVRRESNRADVSKQAKTHPARAANGAPGRAAGQGRGAKERSEEVLVDFSPDEFAKIGRVSALLGITAEEVVQLGVFDGLRKEDPQFVSPCAQRILRKIERAGKVRFSAAAEAAIRQTGALILKEADLSPAAMVFVQQGARKVDLTVQEFALSAVCRKLTEDGYVLPGEPWQSFMRRGEARKVAARVRACLAA